MPSVARVQTPLLSPWGPSGVWSTKRVGVKVPKRNRERKCGSAAFLQDSLPVGPGVATNRQGVSPWTPFVLMADISNRLLHSSVSQGSQSLLRAFRARLSPMGVQGPPVCRGVLSSSPDSGPLDARSTLHPHGGDQKCVQTLSSLPRLKLSPGAT